MTDGKVAVLGAGAWGTALAKRSPRKGATSSSGRDARSSAEAINASRENARYLPGVALPPNLVATHDLARTLDGAEMVVFVVPSHATREVARDAAPYVPRGRADRERDEGHRERLAHVHGRGARRGAPRRLRASTSRSSPARASRASSRATCRPRSSSPPHDAEVRARVDARASTRPTCARTRATTSSASSAAAR